MKIKILCASLLAIASGSAHASLFDNNIEATELVNALAHCPTEFSQFIKGREYVGELTGVFSQVTKRTSSKTYTLVSQSGGGFQRVTVGATLTIVAEVTQPDERIQDAPASISWSCSIKR